MRGALHDADPTDRLSDPAHPERTAHSAQTPDPTAIDATAQASRAARKTS